MNSDLDVWAKAKVDALVSKDEGLFLLDSIPSFEMPPELVEKIRREAWKVLGLEPPELDD